MLSGPAVQESSVQKYTASTLNDSLVVPAPAVASAGHIRIATRGRGTSSLASLLTELAGPLPVAAESVLRTDTLVGSSVLLESIARCGRKM